MPAGRKLSWSRSNSKRSLHLSAMEGALAVSPVQSRMLQNALDSERRASFMKTLANYKTRTLKDMTEEEIQELEAKYNCPVIRPATKE